MANECPACGAAAFRSRSRGIREKVIRAFSHYKAYRCPECGWRGWFVTSSAPPVRARIRIAATALGLIVVVVILVLLLSVSES